MFLEVWGLFSNKRQLLVIITILSGGDVRFYVRDKSFVGSVHEVTNYSSMYRRIQNTICELR